MLSTVPKKFQQHKFTIKVYNITESTIIIIDLVELKVGYIWLFDRKSREFWDLTDHGIDCRLEMEEFDDDCSRLRV